MDTVARNLERYPLLVLDGAFGTELARRGFDTNDELWSAKALFEKPAAARMIVDAVAARENVTRYAKSQGYDVAVTEGDGEWTLDVTRA